MPRLFESISGLTPACDQPGAINGLVERLKIWKNLRHADFSGPAWTLHIIGDGEMALRDFDKTKYWAGEFSIPMSQVEIRRTQR